MSYIGPEPNPGQNREVDDISSGFNGSTTAFTLQVNSQNVSPGSSNNIIISLGGVVQNPSNDYSVAASTLTFTTAPASGLSFFGLVLGQQVDIQSLADGTSPTMSAPTITGDLSIADKIVHTGDTNNAIRFPAADTITAETGGSERVRVDSSGRVGIGTNNPGQLLEINGDTNPAVLIKDTTNDCISYMFSQDSVATFGSASNHDVVFNVNNGEKARILTSGGITFNGDTAAANALDDYEEGTWTPTESSGISLTVYVANYIKIGRVVHIETGLLIATNSDGGALMFGGLPFTAVNSGDNSGGLHLTSTNSGRSDHFFAIRGQTNIGVANNSNQNVARSAYSNKQLKFSGTYISA